MYFFIFLKQICYICCAFWINSVPLRGCTFLSIIQWMMINEITITDPINQILTKTKYIWHKKYAIKRHFGLVQSESVRSHYPNDLNHLDPVKQRPLYLLRVLFYSFLNLLWIFRLNVWILSINILNLNVHLCKLSWQIKKKRNMCWPSFIFMIVFIFEQIILKD